MGRTFPLVYCNFMLTYCLAKKESMKQKKKLDGSVFMEGMNSLYV